jgi:hypothetical protein
MTSAKREMKRSTLNIREAIFMGDNSRRLSSLGVELLEVEGLESIPLGLLHELAVTVTKSKFVQRHENTYANACI